MLPNIASEAHTHRSCPRSDEHESWRSWGPFPEKAEGTGNRLRGFLFIDILHTYSWKNMHFCFNQRFLKAAAQTANYAQVLSVLEKVARKQEIRFRGTEQSRSQRQMFACFSSCFVRSMPLASISSTGVRSPAIDRKSTRLNSSHHAISYAVF